MFTKTEIPLIITASLRQESDTRKLINFIFKDILHDQAALIDYTVLPYNYEGIYNDTDDFNIITNSILKHNIIVFATPVYWYAMSSFMKNLFDRFTDWVTINKETGRKIEGKTFLLIASGSDAFLPEGFEEPFRLTAKYFGAHYGNALYISQKENPINYQERIKLFLASAGLQ